MAKCTHSYRINQEDVWGNEVRAEDAIERDEVADMKSKGGDAQR